MIFIRGRVLGWIYCIPVFVICFFSRSCSVLFLLFYVLCLCFRLICLSFCIYKRTTIYKNINNKLSTRRTHKQQQTDKQQTYIISQPEPERYSFAVGSWAGYPVFMLFVYLFIEVVMFVHVFSLLFMFSPSLFKLLHLQSNKHI